VAPRRSDLRREERFVMGSLEGRLGVFALWALLTSTGSSAVHAQTPMEFFPSRAALPDLLAGPRDPVVSARFMYIADDPTFTGEGPGAEVSLATTLPVVSLVDETGEDAWVFGLEAGVFARFSFEISIRDLVNTDWVFATPLVRWFGDHWLRARYYHASSHLGDEYVTRFEEAASINFSRDAFDLTGYARVAEGLGVYGLAGWFYNSHPDRTTHWRLRGGSELEFDVRGKGPYLALDVQFDEGADWRATTTFQAGLWVQPGEGRPLRVALEVITGATPMGQFYGESTTQLALGLLWNP
jgi:hypothetical protein